MVESAVVETESKTALHSTEGRTKLKTTGNIKISHTPLHKTNKIYSFTH